MAEGATLPATGTVVAGDIINGEIYQRVKAAIGPDGSYADLQFGQAAMTASLPVVIASDQTAIPVSGPLTDTQLRAAAIPVSGTFYQATQPVSGPLTDAQLRAVAVPVSGTFYQGTQPVSGTFWQGTQPISGTVDTELPAAAALADAASNPTTSAVGAALLAYNGATWDRVRTPGRYVDLNGATITTIATVWTPAAGKKFRLMGGMISVDSACSVLFEDNGAGTTIIRTPKLLANTPYNFVLANGILSGAADRVLKATASTGTVTITGAIWGTEE
jgi:hypothetical protein